MGYSPRGREESDSAECLCAHAHTHRHTKTHTHTASLSVSQGERITQGCGFLDGRSLEATLKLPTVVLMYKNEEGRKYAK